VPGDESENERCALRARVACAVELRVRRADEVEEKSATEFDGLCSLAKEFIAWRNDDAFAANPKRLPTFNHSDSLVSLAANHGLLPLLHWAVENGVAELPDDVRVAAWVAYETNARRNRKAEAELRAIVEKLESVGIRALAHKGPALTRWLYESPALRVYSDLDLLVARDRVFAAVDAMSELGYRSDAKIPASHRQRFLRSGRQYDLELEHVESGILLELHWRTDARFFAEDLDAPETFDRAVTVEIDGASIHQLPLRELMFALLVHGSKHQWSRLSWLVDIALLARRFADDDWKWLVRSGIDHSCQARLECGLSLARSLLRTSMPNLDWSQHLSLRAEFHATRIEGILRKEQIPDAPSIVTGIHDDLSLNDRMSQSIAQTCRLIFTPNLRDWHRVGDHPGGLLLAFPRRVASTLWRRART
jgi:Uncharacterised nucleotidyltransferase